MKIVKYLLLFILSIGLGFAILLLGYIYFYNQPVTLQNPLLPVTHFSLENAPSDSLKGKISSLSGNVAWESRTSAIANLISEPITIWQGEEVITQGNGNADVVFPNGINLHMFSSSDLSIIQTLPADIVFEQNQGTIEYQNFQGKLPLSINALDLLLNVNKGSVKILVDKDNSVVNVFVSSGSATAAFTDTDNNPKVQKIDKGSKATFDNNAKTINIAPF